MTLLKYLKLKQGALIHFAIATTLGLILAQGIIHYYIFIVEVGQPPLFIELMKCCKWFFYLGSFVLVFFIYGFVYFLFTKQQSHIKAQQQENLDIKLSLIKNQLDPHFLFNALNSIAFSINKDDKKVAYNNLGVFSKLMRETIVSLDNYSRSIEEEIAYVNHYLFLEKFRFKERFTFDIIISPGTSLVSEVPKMCLFCFVEAALKKGILPGKNSGHIDITIDAAEKKGLYLNVIDNGLHRNLNQTVISSSSSSIKAVINTIDFFNKQNHNKIEISCKDLGTAKKPKGSKVNIFIPYQYSFIYE